MTPLSFSSNRLAAAALSMSAVLLAAWTSAPADERIRPYAENPRYWQYRGEPLLLLGGSDDDNPFQSPNLRQQLDEMKAVGANYLRNTMSDRRDKGFEVYPFKKLPSGEYDLARWNDEYWRRLENMLRWTQERGIIVQIEVWDRFDYSDNRGSGNWSRHPYNPKNNVNYTTEQSGLKTTYTQHPNRNGQPFFYTVPALQNNTTVLPYQQAQVDKMLEISLKYGHVLYCMDNETSASPQWGKYWSERIRQRARQAQVEVYTTEMWDKWDPLDSQHRHTFDHPRTYAFVDVSQNNHNRSQPHWDNFQAVRGYLEKHPRPINTVKIYGADGGRYGDSRDGQERFWRNIFAGAAGTRFHRPDAGLGLSDLAKSHIKSMRLLTAELDVFRCRSDVQSELLSDRSENEAYLTYVADQQYAVYFPNGGDVKIDLGAADGLFSLRWLDIVNSRWHDPQTVQGGRKVDLTAPGRGHWCCLLLHGK